MPDRLLARVTERIRQLREQRGVTQEEFAELAEISYKYYQAIEAGRKIDLRLSTLERLAKAHGLDVWELLLPQMPAQMATEGKAKYASRSPRRSPRKK